VQKNRGIIATIDVELKRRIKENGGSILSVYNDRIILESSKI
jgi:rRNA-processing protein FCF1